MQYLHFIFRPSLDEDVFLVYSSNLFVLNSKFYIVKKLVYTKLEQ